MTTRDLFAPDDWIDPAPPSSKTIKERYALELQVLAEIRSGTREVRYIIPPSNGYEGCHTFDAVLCRWLVFYRRVPHRGLWMPCGSYDAYSALCEQASRLIEDRIAYGEDPEP